MCYNYVIFFNFMGRCEGYNRILNQTFLTKPAYIKLRDTSSRSGAIEKKSWNTFTLKTPQNMYRDELFPSKDITNDGFRIPRKSARLSSSDIESTQTREQTTDFRTSGTKSQAASLIYPDLSIDYRVDEDIFISKGKDPYEVIMNTLPSSGNDLFRKYYSSPTLLTAMNKESVLIGTSAALECMVSSYKYRNKIIWEKLDENDRVDRGMEKLQLGRYQ